MYHGITTSGTELPFGLCHLHLKAADKFPKRPFVSNIRQAITSFSELVSKRFEFDCVVVGSIQISVCHFSARLHRASEIRVKRAIGVGC